MNSKKKELMKLYKEQKQDSCRDMETSMKRYLDGMAAKDAGFASRYEPKKFKQCVGYVVECARELLDGRNGNVADEVCYKMAMDFYNERLWEDDKPTETAVEPAKDGAEASVAINEEKPAERAVEQKHYAGEQLSLFGGMA